MTWSDVGLLGLGALLSIIGGAASQAIAWWIRQKEQRDDEHKHLLGAAVDAHRLLEEFNPDLFDGEGESVVAKRLNELHSAADSPLVVLRRAALLRAGSETGRLAETVALGLTVVRGLVYDYERYQWRRALGVGEYDGPPLEELHAHRRVALAKARQLVEALQ